MPYLSESTPESDWNQIFKYIRFNSDANMWKFDVILILALILIYAASGLMNVTDIPSTVLIWRRFWKWNRNIFTIHSLCQLLYIVDRCCRHFVPLTLRSVAVVERRSQAMAAIWRQPLVWRQSMFVMSDRHLTISGIPTAMRRKHCKILQAQQGDCWFTFSQPSGGKRARKRFILGDASVPQDDMRFSSGEVLWLSSARN